MRRKGISAGNQRQDNPRASGGVALLWDESFLWGIMSYKALQKVGLPFDLIRAGEIKKGRLENYAVLFVPGGWSSNKMKALGDEGGDSIKTFVHNGGSYLGLCGGAGLAGLDGLGLLNIKRKPTQERVPSFSGRIALKTFEHPLWTDIREPVFHAWWPPQFFVPAGDDIRILATYQDALPDSFSSDLNTGDIVSGGRWQELEQRYEINLDPKRLIGDPAVIEGTCGRGRVMLSLVHFDTPDDANGEQVMRNIWEVLSPGGGMSPVDGKYLNSSVSSPPHFPILPLLRKCEAAVTGLIDFGIRNFLWFWRNPMLLQWRRGVRGLEYCTLYIMMREIAERLNERQHDNNAQVEEQLQSISRRLFYFSQTAKALLMRERLAMQNARITYDRCDDPEIQKIREKLFSSSKSHGGLFKILLDELDNLLYLLLAQEKG